MEQVTIDSIIAYLGEKIEKHEPLPPSIFLDAAIKMNDRGQSKCSLAGI